MEQQQQQHKMMEHRLKKLHTQKVVIGSTYYNAFFVNIKWIGY